jgi:hypothetical protein
MFSWLYFQMNMNNYPHVTIAEDGSLCSMGQHHLRFLNMLYDTLLYFGHNGDVPVYRGHMSKAYGQDRCEVSVTLPLSPTELWGTTIVGVELDETVGQAAHVALTTLCETRLDDTAAMPIALFPIREQEEPMWRQHLQDVTDSEGPHFHSGMAVMTKYAQYIFNLQRNTVKTVVQQRLWMTFLEQHVEGLRHENAILCSGTLPPSGQDRELLVTYHRLSEAEHGWHYAIIHLEHHFEQHDLDLEERAATIATLE